MMLKEKVALAIGAVGIFILDLGFNGSAASDLFFPPQLRKALPPVIKNASLPLPPTPSPPPGLGGYVPAGQNIYLYFIGGAVLAVAMLMLILANRNLPKGHSQTAEKAPAPEPSLGAHGKAP